MLEVSEHLFKLYDYISAKELLYRDIIASGILRHYYFCLYKIKYNHLDIFI